MRNYTDEYIPSLDESNNKLPQLTRDKILPVSMYLINYVIAKVLTTSLNNSLGG